jgi:hypothetical protein
VRFPLQPSKSLVNQVNQNYGANLPKDSEFATIFPWGSLGISVVELSFSLWLL